MAAMDDAARLRRTVRRCTAVLVAALGVASWVVAEPPGQQSWLVLSLPAVLYLTGSVLFAVIEPADPSATSAE